MARDRRQEIYERIRVSSKDEVVLEEMVKLGFWPRRGSPGDPADEIRRRGEIAREIDALRQEEARLGNLEAMRREARLRRMEESRRRQKETKLRRERERLVRAEAWARRKAGEIVYLGRGVSGGLGRTDADEARLLAQGLPLLRTAGEIAAAMGIGVPELRFLAFSRRVSRTSHYRRFAMPKKTGGLRLISAPMRRLKAAQRWVLENVLERVRPHEAAHGFRKERSIVTNASPHVGAAVVVNVDLRDFFPSVNYARVKGLFEGFGYGEHAATIFALLSTAPDVEEVEVDGERAFVVVGKRRLPQGAPTSPAITNAICRRLDRRLEGMARRLGFSYTRYADDLTFSSRDAGAAVGKLLARVRFVVAAEGFEVHPDKTRVLRRGRRQEVTGVVVNDRMAAPRPMVRRLRAVLHQIERSGPEGKQWEGSENVLAGVVGYAAFVAMVDPARGASLLARARTVAERHGYRPAPRPRLADAPAAPLPAAPLPEPPPPKKKWWKLF